MGSRNTICSSYADLSGPSAVKRLAMSAFRNSIRSCKANEPNELCFGLCGRRSENGRISKLKPTCTKSSARATPAGLAAVRASAAALRCQPAPRPHPWRQLSFGWHCATGCPNFRPEVAEAGHLTAAADRITDVRLAFPWLLAGCRSKLDMCVRIKLNGSCTAVPDARSVGVVPLEKFCLTGGQDGSGPQDSQGCDLGICSRASICRGLECRISRPASNQR